MTQNWQLSLRKMQKVQMQKVRELSSIQIFHFFKTWNKK